MTRYHVYGIGNALVDKEFEVEEHFLTEQGIDKGVMTLVPHEQQEQLLTQLKQRYGVKKRASGGSAANTIIAVSHFGGKCYYACKLGDDEPGDFYLHDLTQAGVSSNINGARPAGGVTGRCLVMVSADAERTMHSFLGISATLDIEDIDFDALKRSEFLYLEGYLVTSDSSRAAAIAAREFAERHGIKTSLTFSDPNMVQHFKPGISAMLGNGVDLLFCNEHEARLFTGAESLMDAAEQLRRVAKQFAITCGARGALLYDGAGLIEVDSVPVHAIDTNGAGDMFAGAFLYALNHGYDFTAAGRLANRAAAAVVSRFGPRLEAEQHAELLRQLAEKSWNQNR